MRNIKTAPFTVKSVDEPAGIIERVVSVFGNVDYGGDAVQVGAFTDSIERWKASGDPIPVVFSHDWSNLDAHLGVVDDIKELPPGDPLLPDEIKDNGGLWVREKYDLHIPAAARAFELQQRRSLKESSFAYNTISERKTKNGVNELLALDLIEVGPCLKGMNPATQLLAAKSVDPGAELPELDSPEAWVGETAPAEPPADDIGRVGILPVDGPLETEQKSPGHHDHVHVDTKAFVILDGSYEKLIEDLGALLPNWTTLNFPNEDWWYVGIEATYSDHLIVYMETFADPPGRGNYQQAGYGVDDAGLRIEAPTLVAISGNVVPKALRLAGEKLASKANRGNPDGDPAEPAGGLTPASFLAVADMEVAALTAVSREGETA